MRSVFSILAAAAICVIILVEAANEVLVGIKDIDFNSWQTARDDPANKDIVACWNARGDDVKDLDDSLDWDTWRLYCYCLHDTKVPYMIDKNGKRIIDEAHKGLIGFCRLHAMMLFQPDHIGRKKLDLSIGFKKNVATKDLEKQIFINPGIYSGIFKFQCSTLTWNESTKKLTFESCGDVGLVSTRVSWKILDDKKRDGMIEFKPDPSGVSFKFEATIITSKQFGLVKQTVVDAGPSCIMQIREKTLPVKTVTIGYATPVPHTPQVIQAMGGMEQIKKDLIDSACKRFEAGINFAIAQQSKDQKWDVMKQPDYAPKNSEGIFVKYEAGKIRDD